jgi:hypothetical protein
LQNIKFQAPSLRVSGVREEKEKLKPETSMKLVYGVPPPQKKS